MTRDELLAKTRKRFEEQLPRPPRNHWAGVVPDPAPLHGDEYDEAATRDLIEEAVPAGWELRGIDRVPRRHRDGWEYRVRLDRAEPVPPPWPAARVLELYEEHGGKWSAVAGALGVPQRELERWLEHDEYADLADLWHGRQRARGGRRHRRT